MNLFYCSLRQKNILKLLLNKKDYTSSKSLSESLGVTDRTIRNDIGTLNYVLQKYDSTIVSERGKGYLLVSDNLELIRSIIFHHDDNRAAKMDRFAEILIYLLLVSEETSLDDLEDALYISRSTLNVELKNIKSILNNSYPTLSVTKKQGLISIAGSEESIRFLLNEIVMLKFDAVNQVISTNQFMVDSNLFLDILKRVQKKALDYNLHLDDSGVTDVAIYLLIARKRLVLGRKLKKSNIKNIDHCKTVDTVANELFHEILNGTVALTDEECEHEKNEIAVKLAFMNVCQPLKMNDPVTGNHMPEQIHNIVSKLLESIKEDYQLDLSADEELYRGLAFHIRALMNRVQHQQILQNPLVEEIKKQYPFIFELSLNIYEIFQSVVGVSLKESELSYVAAHIAASVERRSLNYGNVKLVVGIVSHLTNSYSKLLGTNIQRLCGSRVHVLSPYPVYRYEELLEQRPHLIVSTYPVEENKSNGIEVITISPIPTQEEQITIRKKLEIIRDEMIYNNRFSEEGVLSKFNKNVFFPNLDLKTKEDVLQLMSDSMHGLGLVPEIYHSGVMRREKLASTVLNNGIAIPHPLNACAHRTTIGVALLKEPIQWDSQKVQVVFMLAIKQEEKACIKEVFRLLEGVMNHKEQVEMILKSSSFDEYMKHMKNSV